MEIIFSFKYKNETSPKKNKKKFNKIMTVPKSVLVDNNTLDPPCYNQDGWVPPGEFDVIEALRDFCTRHDIDAHLGGKLLQLQGYDLIVICDDSGSMNARQDWWLHIKEHIRFIAEVAQIVNWRGITVHFLNRPSLVNIGKNSASLDTAFETLPFGNTPIVSALRHVLRGKDFALDPNETAFMQFWRKFTRRQYRQKAVIVALLAGEPTDCVGNPEKKNALKRVWEKERGPDDVLKIVDFRTTIKGAVDNIIKGTHVHNFLVLRKEDDHTHVMANAPPNKMAWCAMLQLRQVTDFSPYSWELSEDVADAIHMDANHYKHDTILKVPLNRDTNDLRTLPVVNGIADKVVQLRDHGVSKEMIITQLTRIRDGMVAESIEQQRIRFMDVIELDITLVTSKSSDDTVTHIIEPATETTVVLNLNNIDTINESDIVAVTRKIQKIDFASVSIQAVADKLYSIKRGMDLLYKDRRIGTIVYSQMKIMGVALDIKYTLVAAV